MLSKGFELQVLVNGKPVKEYLHQGNTYIEGKEKSEFSLMVKNNTFQQVLAVISIDGKNIVDGKDCDLHNSSGYVIPAYGHTKIPGWRLNNDEIAKFFFSDGSESYAAKMENDENAELNIGIIGCAIFAEKSTTYWTSWTPWIPCETNANDRITYQTNPQSRDSGLTSLSHFSYEASSTSNNVEQLGTGFGKKESNSVNTTTFDRKDMPETIITIQYDSRQGLKNRGVTFRPTISINPNPFPATSTGCKPPKGWQAE